MACSKYTLTNTGSSIANFSYRRCDDNMWEYQVPLDPSETKNIWLINGTYGTAFANTINKIDLGAFPPVNATATPTPTPTQTPTQTPTPSVTAQVTPTPTPSTTTTLTASPTSSPTPSTTTTLTASPTPTQTLTPTESNTPLRTAFTCCHSETSAIGACSCDQTATIFGENPVFTVNSQFYGCDNGPCPGVDLSGWYVNSGVVYELNSTGNVLGFSGCSVTPTPTPTMTVTPSITPSPTSTPTFVQYSLGTGLTSNSACIATPQPIYGNPSQVDGPDFGETLYSNSSLTTTVPNGYYSNGTNWYQVTGGSGVISAGGLC